ncbi:hypothetical protein [Mucilaginibacter psychrotolerans]|uniref:Uncharacterized protein n=1 Tax=Mucilaginibacter psychrotolerans TaxID=1524096 RepID=A0A4Y8S704_9SPHI|nr:hypothetical protein [Mucilaginibacter psychrotolerans]TFF34385.1 hypothetical protein E2R66_22180 [Mucilaginibacter psychrotolerans]
MACDSLIQTAKECGKNTKDGVSSDVYLIAFSDLKAVTGSTEVYSTSVSGLVSAIALASGTTKFVKYGTVAKAASIKETYTYNDNGTYDIAKELTFTLSNVGSVDAKAAAEKLVSNPVAALVKLENKTWVAFGLNGQFMAKTMEGAAGTGSNGRVITLAGSDTEFLQPVDPTIISGLIAA